MTDLKALLKKIGGGVIRPFTKIDDHVAAEINEKVSVVVASALAQAPILDALLDGKAVTVDLSITLQCRVDGKTIA